MTVIIAALLFFWLSRPALVLVNDETDEVYRRFRAGEGTEFSVTFIHSVNQTPVCDVFVIAGGEIRAKETIYSGFGAGVQSELEPGQTLRYNERGEMVVSGFDFTYDPLRYIVGTVSDHTLEIDGETISLRDLCGRNAHVAFEYRRFGWLG